MKSNNWWPEKKDKIRRLLCRLDAGNGVRCNKNTCEGCKDAEDWGYEYDLEDEIFNETIDLCRTSYEKEVAEGRIIEDVPSLDSIAKTVCGVAHLGCQGEVSRPCQNCVRIAPVILARLKGKKCQK